MRNNMLDYGSNQRLRKTHMMKIPHYLYTKDIIKCIKGFINAYQADDFDSLQNVEKDMLISYALTASEFDIDIVLSRDTNRCFSDYIKSYRYDGLFKLERSIQQDYYDHFSPAFNYMFAEIIDETMRAAS